MSSVIEMSQSARTSNDASMSIEKCQETFCPLSITEMSDTNMPTVVAAEATLGLTQTCKDLSGHKWFP